MRLNSPKPNNGFMEISSISNEIRHLHRGPRPHLGDGYEILATPASIASTETIVQAKDRGRKLFQPSAWRAYTNKSLWSGNALEGPEQRYPARTSNQWT